MIHRSCQTDEAIPIPFQQSKMSLGLEHNWATYLELGTNISFKKKTRVTMRLDYVLKLYTSPF